MAHRRTRRPVEVFLSHSHADRLFVRRLADLLGRHGVRTWLSSHRLRGADEWHDEIRRALRRCDWFVVLLTPSAVRSRWVKHELLYALDDPRYVRRIIPVLVRTCDPRKLSWTLAQFQQVRFTAGFRRGATDLLATWGIRLKS